MIINWSDTFIKYGSDSIFFRGLSLDLLLTLWADLACSPLILRENDNFYNKGESRWLYILRGSVVYNGQDFSEGDLIFLQEGSENISAKFPTIPSSYAHEKASAAGYQVPVVAKNKVYILQIPSANLRSYFIQQAGNKEKIYFLMERLEQVFVSMQEKNAKLALLNKTKDAKEALMRYLSSYPKGEAFYLNETLKDLAKILHISRPHLYRLLHLLEENSLIKREGRVFFRFFD